MLNPRPTMLAMLTTTTDAGQIRFTAAMKPSEMRMVSAPLAA